MKKFLSLLTFSALALLPFGMNAQDASSGAIKATITDEKGEAMPGAIVILLTPSGQRGSAADMDGNATFRAVSPGTYDVQARVVGYKVFTKKGIEVNAGQVAYATFPMQLIDNDTVFTVYAQRSPVDPQSSTIQNLSSFTVQHMAADRGNVLSMVTGSNSQVSEGPNGGLVMRGAREDATATYVDGEIMYGSIGVAAGSIEQISVLSGGIPASYGDVTGGIVIITTKSYWDGVAAKQDAIDAYTADTIAQHEAALEKSGVHVEDHNTIIENSGGTSSSSSGTSSSSTGTSTTTGTTSTGTAVPKE